MQVTAATVTEENFHDVVQVASTGCGDGSVLIEGLRQVWGPTLRSSALSTSCLKNLEERLLSSGFSTTAVEEEEFWKRKQDEVKRSHERTNCEEAAKSVKNIRGEIESAAVSRCTLLLLLSLLFYYNYYLPFLIQRWINRCGGSLRSYFRIRG